MQLTSKRFIICALTGFVILALAHGSQAQEKGEGIRVGHSAICLDVQDHEPVGVDTTFNSDVGSLCCFSRIEGATDSTAVTHVWYYGNKKVAEVTLRVESSRWRTYSKKKILPRWTGKWNVVILSAAGDPLAQLSFFIKASQYE